MQKLLVNQLLLHRTSIFFFPRCLSTSLPSIQNPQTKSPFAVEYLIKSCGLPTEKARNAAKYIPHLRTCSKPDSVLQFLCEVGLNKDDIRKTVVMEPRILCANLENTIKPRVKEIREIGFSPEQVVRLVPLSPVLLISKYDCLQKTIQFWLSVLGDFDGILRALKRAPYLLTVSVDKVIKKNISFLESCCEVSRTQIRVMLIRTPSVFTMNPGKLKQVAEKAEKLGIPHGSLFIYALHMTRNNSSTNLNAKIKNLKNLGFSDKEVDSMIKKQPMLLSNSAERIQKGVAFLTGEAGLDNSYIAIYPALISFSLERRLIPRYVVMKSLKSKGLFEAKNFAFFVKLSEEEFADKFIRPYRDVIPNAVEIYEAAIAAKFRSNAKSDKH